MALHDELLKLAKELVDRNPCAAIGGDLRRGVSTAYYAVFHLLISEATGQFITDESIKARLARSFDHKIMRKVCHDYALLPANPAGNVIFAGQPVPKGIQDIAIEFEALQDARHAADYDTTLTITQSQAQSDVARAENVFALWNAARTDPAAITFLIELLCRGLPKR